jgi:hypothetical protein
MTALLLESATVKEIQHGDKEKTAMAKAEVNYFDTEHIGRKRSGRL